MTNEDDDKELYEGCQIYLGRIEREKALMVAAGADTKKVNEHQEWIAKYKRLLAKHSGAAR